MTNYARAVLLALAAIMTLLLIAAVAYGQRPRGTTPNLSATPQPLFSEYKGIRLGMTAQEVRAKLGGPRLKGDDQDYYVISETETAQFAYDKAQQVVTISIDYTGVGAPDYRNVVGVSIDQREDGSLYKLVRYEAQHFWVSYHRTSGTPATVTITIQKM
jgi:outer membrane protein assembly factor BamE (lipoprotein component of BamABCDE complex)